MSSLLQVIGYFALALALGAVIGSVFSKRRRPGRPRIKIAQSAKARLVGPQGVYRCYFVADEAAGLVFSSPLQRDNYVPLRVGEPFMVQIPTTDGVITFRTEVLSRDATTHQFVVAYPDTYRMIDRRAELRETVFDGHEATINGHAALLCDLSPSGAKLVTQGELIAGESVTVTLPDGRGTCDGWALESIPGAFGNAPGRVVRVRFAEPICGPSTWARI